MFWSTQVDRVINSITRLIPHRQQQQLSDVILIQPDLTSCCTRWILNNSHYTCNDWRSSTSAQLMRCDVIIVRNWSVLTGVTVQEEMENTLTYLQESTTIHRLFPQSLLSYQTYYSLQTLRSLHVNSNFHSPVVFFPHISCFPVFITREND